MSEKRALGAEIFRERKYPFLGHLRKDEKVAALTLTSMLATLCFNAGIRSSANSSKPLCNRQHCHLVWMAGMAVGQHNLPTGSCRQDRVSIEMETRSCLKKSSFLEPLRDIEQRHLSSSGNDISFISRRQVQSDRPCENAPMIN
jgi:hypothetical protein